MGKLIILNEAGGSLRNLPGCTFNQSGRAIGKDNYFWTFSDRKCDLENKVYSPTLQKALKHLEDHGFKNLQVVQLTEEVEEDQHEKAARKAVKSGKKQPRTNEEARELLKEIAPEELEEDGLYIGYQERCIACTKACKQSPRSVFYGQCPVFDPLDKQAA